MRGGSVRGRLTTSRKIKVESEKKSRLFKEKSLPVYREGFHHALCL